MATEERGRSVFHFLFRFACMVQRWWVPEVVPSDAHPLQPVRSVMPKEVMGPSLFLLAPLTTVEGLS